MDKSNIIALGRYAQLLQQARYFQIEKLARWIEEKRFCDVVKLEWRYDEHEKPDGSSIQESRSILDERQYPMLTIKQRSWVCPRDIACNEGTEQELSLRNSQQRCGEKCEKAGGGSWVTRYVHRLWHVTKAITIDFDKLTCTE